LVPSDSQKLAPQFWAYAKGGNMKYRARLARFGRAAVALAVGVTGSAALAQAPAQAAVGPVVVSLTFDDGLNSQYQLAPTLERHGVRGTFYVNTNALDTGGDEERFGTMSWNRVRQLAAAGHEIGGHTLDHRSIIGDTLTLAEKRAQVCDDRARLVDNGLNPRSFAYPEGHYDETAIQVVSECGYRTARLAGGVSASGDPQYAESNPPRYGAYMIRALGPSHNGPITLEDLRGAAEAAYNNGGGWLPMLFHRVCYAGTASYDACMASYRPVDAAVIDQFLTWVGGHSGISVRTVSQTYGGLTPPPPPPPDDNPPPSDDVSRPELTKVSRGVLGQGARNATVWLTGRFDSSAKVSFSGPGVKHRVVRRSSTSLKLKVSVSTGAKISARTVTVVNEDGGKASCSRCLKVVKGPKITSLRPNTAARARVTKVIVYGAAFNRATTVRVGGTGVRVRAVEVLGPRRMRVAVKVAPGARRTARAVTVFNKVTLGQSTLPRSLRIR
jgi:peptidoglycan/xylan/chitin deacetylase (PgdA/CDA1 family)